LSTLPIDQAVMPTILVVDDTPTNLEIIGALLGGLYKIKAAISGERALKLLADTKLPDLILLDVMMPGISGWEVCTAVKSDPRTKDIPVIFLTSKIELADETKGFELGAVDYITKPINPLTLHARVKTHLALQSALHRLKDHNQSLEKEVDSKGQQIALKDQELQNLNKLKRFFSAPVAQQILASGGDDLLKPHRREISVLFFDLRGFTSIVVEAEPEEVMRILSDYHKIVGEYVTKYQGTIEHFEGDGVVVFLNDPVPIENAALAAINMAQEVQHAFSNIQDKWRRKKLEIGLGVGIATGFATLGLIGFEGRVDYAAIGSVTNLAARLCSEAKDGEIIFDARSEANLEKNADITPSGFLQLKGFPKPIEAFLLIRGTELVM